MALVTLELLNDVIDNEGLAYIGTPMAVAYLNYLMGPLVVYMRQLAMPTVPALVPRVPAIEPTTVEVGDDMPPLDLVNTDGINEQAVRDLLAISTMALGTVTADGAYAGAVRELLRRIMNALPPAGYPTTSSEIEYEALTLTPWEIVEAISEGEGLHDFFGTHVQTMIFRLPVSVIVNGNLFTHLMTLDMAVGILLLARTAGVDLRMTISGEPLTYFIEGQDDLWLRYDDIATEDECNIRMIGSDRRYYFFDNDFLQGIKTAAEWLGVDHHDYWDSFQDMEGHSLTF